MRHRGNLTLKVSGGVTAQLLALITGLHFTNLYGKQLRIKYFPYSTGTYWPFGLTALLQPGEIFVESKKFQPSTSSGISVGQVISGSNYKRVLRLPHVLKSCFERLGLLNLFRQLKSEIVLHGQYDRLELVTSKTRSIVGNFPPFMNTDIANELHFRFAKAGIPSPFGEQHKKFVVTIHYRLGDMRKMPSRIPGLGGHGVVKPRTFLEILRKEKVDIENQIIALISDEPEIAQKALLEEGIKTEVASRGSVWEDLTTIAGSKLFIGSMSQFSIVGALFCAYLGGRPYLPSTAYGERDLERALRQPQFNYFHYEYLATDHWMFRNHG
jgi:hypothetical protein